MADRRARRRRLAALLAGAVLGPVLVACGGSTDGGDGIVSGVRMSDPDGMHGTVLTTPYTWPKGKLVDTSGEEVELRGQFEQPLTLVFFGYSMCPDICQAVMADLASAHARLDESQAAQVDTWFVTTDPARDDAATLRRYLDRFDPGFRGFTGPLDDIVAIARAVHVPIEKGEKLPSGGYEVSHGTPILGVTPDGEVPLVWTEGTSAAKLAEDVQRLLAEGVPAMKEEAGS